MFLISQNIESYDVQLPENDAIFAFSRFKLTAIDNFGNLSTDYGDNYFYY